MTEKIICECGMLVKGTTKKHVEANLKIHKKSKLHNMLMKAKKSAQNGLKQEKNRPEFHNKATESGGSKSPEKSPELFGKQDKYAKGGKK